MNRLVWPGIYLLSVVVVNAMFILLPPFSVGGVMLTWGSFMVGFTFSFRDYAQRAIGHRVLWVTLIGVVVTACMSPQLAFASGVAFLVSELADWAVFSRFPGSFKARVVASNVIGAPLDSALFMALAGFFSWPGAVAMTVSKLAALTFLFFTRDDA